MKQYFDLSGNIIYDPCIGEFLRVGQEIPTFDFVKANNDILNLNDTFMAELEQQHINCGYRDYIDKVSASASTLAPAHTKMSSTLPFLRRSISQIVESMGMHP